MGPPGPRSRGTNSLGGVCGAHTHTDTHAHTHTHTYTLHHCTRVCAEQHHQCTNVPATGGVQLKAKPISILVRRASFVLSATFCHPHLCVLISTPVLTAASSCTHSLGVDSVGTVKPGHRRGLLATLWLGGFSCRPTPSSMLASAVSSLAPPSATHLTAWLWARASQRGHV